MSSGKTLLILEDDAHWRQAMRDALASAGHRVLEADCVKVALHLLQKEKPDLLILDVELPDGSGVDVCARAHKARPDIPVIMLTGKSGIEDKAAGFGAGADQYLVKPVPVQELLLWVQALLRRLSPEKTESSVLEAGELAIDLDAHLVRFRGTEIPDLRRKEFELLYFLVKHRPKVLSRQHILSNLWHTIRVDHVVDAHITNLRKKLPQALSDRVQNVPGVGFRYLD